MAKEKAPKIDSAGRLAKGIIERLPFELTGAQERAIAKIREYLSAGIPMRVLLQGDVGAGKTLVGLMAMLDTIEAGCQALFLAPTEVLAEQHYKKIKELCEGLGNTALLTSSTKTAERRDILDGLKDGSIDILIGTHALLYDKVTFKNLAFAIIDEQHRFGVAQRERILSKGKSVHLLVMTATPIPRTLSLTLYGEMESIILDELPKLSF